MKEYCNSCCDEEEPNSNVVSRAETRRSDTSTTAIPARTATWDGRPHKRQAANAQRHSHHDLLDATSPVSCPHACHANVRAPLPAQPGQQLKTTNIQDHRNSCTEARQPDPCEDASSVSNPQAWPAMGGDAHSSKNP